MWYGYAPLDHRLKRDLLAAMDPQTWGNVWPASNIPYDMSCCPCQLPSCAGNCAPMAPVGWQQPEPTPEPAIAEPEPQPEPETPYFPPPEEKHEVITVPGKG
jgi:hypothetical protein